MNIIISCHKQCFPGSGHKDFFKKYLKERNYNIREIKKEEIKTFDRKMLTSDMYRIVIILMKPTNFNTRDKNWRGFPSDVIAHTFGGSNSKRNTAKTHHETRGMK